MKTSKHVQLDHDVNTAAVLMLTLNLNTDVRCYLCMFNLQKAVTS